MSISIQNNYNSMSITYELKRHDKGANMLGENVSFDREALSMTPQKPPSFVGKVWTKEELQNSWKSEVENNQGKKKSLYEMMMASCQEGTGAKFKFVVEVVVNKAWEVEPFLDSMLKFDTFSKPYVLLSPREKTNYMASCRAEFHWQREDGMLIDVIVRCIQDIMSDPNKGKSNSQEKDRLLPDYIRADKPNLIISVSTAESTPFMEEGGKSCNGSVLIGETFFIYDAREFDPSTESYLDVTEALLTNTVLDSVAGGFDGIQEYIDRFMMPEHSPAEPMQIMVKTDGVSIGVVNVENYKCYKEADAAAYNCFVKQYMKDTVPMCIETTHGIVKMSAGDIPTFFVSPIVDRYEKFDIDVDDKQNYASAYNAGVAVAAFIAKLYDHK